MHAGEIVSGRYRIQKLLGEGGMGAVYLAEHAHMRKRVALKLLRSEMSSNPEAIARFEREALAAAHIDHPNVVAALDCGKTEDGAFFLVLEYVDGTSLREALSSPLPVPRAIHIARQIALALDCAHEAGIVHRDLKPENVMLVRRSDNPDFVKVLDFGIAKVPVESFVEVEGRSQTILTKMGAVLGTPEYMSPEQSIGDPVGPASDLYALGIIMYEMLTGLHPFDPPNSVLMLTMHVLEPVPSMHDRAPAVVVPEPVEAVVRRLLEKEPKARFQRASELVQVLDTVAASTAGDRARAAFAEDGLLAALATPPTSKRRPGIGGSAVITTVRAFVRKNVPGARALVRNIHDRVRDALAVVIERAKKVSALSRRHADLKRLRLARPHPIALALGIAAPTAVALVVVILAITVTRKPESAREVFDDAQTSAAPQEVVQPPPAPARATPEQIEAAARDPEALEALDQQFPTDVAVVRELVLAYDDNGRTDDALRTIGRMLTLDPVVDPRILAIVVRSAAHAHGETADNAFALLEGPLGAQGVDFILELTRVRQLAVRQRALKSLAKPEVRALASPRVAVLLDLQEASTCEAKRDLLERVAQDGDVRILPALRVLKARRGCGFLNLDDCWSCLRHGRALDDAIDAVSDRGR